MKLIISIGLLLPAATALAQSNVTVYGMLDVALSRTSVADVRATRLESGVSNGSRFGLRGMEDLGEGLSANFVLEGGMAVDTGASQQGGLLFGRQAYVGLSSHNGWSVSVGRQYSPMNLALVAADASGQIYWVNTNTTGNGFYMSPAAAGGDPGFQANFRVNNSMLATLKLGATTLRAMYSLGDENASGSGRMANIGAVYAGGPVTLSASYARARQFAKDVLLPANAAWQDEWMVGGAYDFGVVKLNTGYYRFNPAEGNKVATPTTFTETHTFWVGGRLPLGQDALYVQAFRTRSERLTTPTGTAHSFGLAYEHPLSKRTALYASYGQVMNDAYASTSVVASVATLNSPSQLGVDAKVLSVGMRHAF
jgi:predicted porin